jgi:hypothetical protein
MSSDSNAAIKQFVENADRYSDRQPENFNLYHGLANLAAAVANIEMKLDIVIQQLTSIQQGGR